MNNLKSLLDGDEATIPVDAVLKKRLHTQLAPARRRFIWPLLLPALGTAVLALLVTTSPLSFTPETSFLQRAQAAYEEIAERAQTEGLIHHTVTEIIQQPGSIYEKWSSVSGDFSLFIDRENGRKFMTIGEDSYVLPEENAQARSGQAESERIGATDGPQYVLRTPDNVASTRMENDPEDPTVMCYSFEYQTEEQQTENALLQRIFKWKEGNGSVDDMQDLLSALSDPHFEDLGEVSIETGEVVHGYRFTTSGWSMLDISSRSIHEFYFDPSTYLLITHRWIMQNGNETNITDFHSTINEFVSASSLDAAFFTPEAHGLEPMADFAHPEDLPSYDMHEGCIRETPGSTSPEYLSDQEAAEVRARIDALHNE